VASVNVGAVVPNSADGVATKALTDERLAAVLAAADLAMRLLSPS
jgi:hypothetical protein